MAEHKLPRKDVAPRPDQTELRVGRLTKAHGLKGAIKVELYTDEPERRFVPYNGHPVAFFVGVDDRTEAETLIKAILWVSQDARQLPEEEDAWYDHQLVGLSARRDGVEVGTIARVDHLPAQDLLVVRTADGEVLVPFVSAIVPEVDLAAGTVTLTPPAGLFEEIPDDEPASAEGAADEKPADEKPDDEKPADADSHGAEDAATEPENGEG